MLIAPSVIVQADHLLRIVERQPSCLLRVGIDGVILAANDAALALLDAREPAQVLGSNLMAWIVPGHQDNWRDLAQSASLGASQSAECDLAVGSGARRSVVLHGVPLLDHPDGIPSLILGVRDTTVLRHLEAALQESESARQELEMKFEHAKARLPQLEQLLKQGRTHLQNMRTQLDAATEQMTSLLTERDRLASQLRKLHSMARELS